MRVALEFFAELSDKDAEVFGLLGGLRAPDGGEQGAMGEDLAGVAGEEEQEVKFLGGEVDGAAAYGDRMRGGIDEEVADFDGRIAGALGGAAQMGADAGKEFLDAEGFGDVVVGAGIEGFDFGVLLIANGENEDGGAAGAADGAAEVDAGHAGHHEVGDDEVGMPFLEETEGLFGVIRGAHVVALGGERGAQDAGDLDFVVYDEDSFRHSSRAGL